MVTASPVITRLVDLYDVPALADGQTIVKQGGVLVAADIGTQAEVDAVAAAAVVLAPASSTRNVVQPSGPAVVGFTVKGATSQSEDILRIQLADSSTPVKVDSGGILHSYTGTLLGNDSDSNPGPNTGSPPGNVLPIRMQHHFGVAGVPVVQTTQMFAGWTTYRERTLDDSAESASFGIVLNDAWGGFASPQTLPVVAFEADALVQGNVSVTNKVVALVAGVKIQNNAHADSAMGLYIAQTFISSTGSLGSRYGIYDEGYTGGGIPTNAWTLYGKHTLQTEDRLLVGVGGTVSNGQRALIVGSNSPDVPTLDMRNGSGQTAAAMVVTDSGSIRRGQWFGQTGNIMIGSTATGGSGVAIISMATVTAPTGTPPAHGFFLYVDPADDKLKAKGSSGTITELALP